MNLVLTLIVAAIPVYIVASLIYGYLAAPGTTWERLVAAFKGSATLAVTRVNALSIALIGFLGDVAPYIGATGVKEAIEPYLTGPFLAGYMLVVLIGAEIARRRTLA